MNLNLFKINSLFKLAKPPLFILLLSVKKIGINIAESYLTNSLKIQNNSPISSKQC